MNAQVVENTGHRNGHDTKHELLCSGLGLPLLHPVFQVKPSVFCIEDNARVNA